MKKAVVLFSGGLDSTTCLAIAKAEGYKPYALSFDYGQKHRAELNAAKKIAQKQQIEHQTISLSIGELGGSALTDQQLTVPNYNATNAIPTTYVPARNTVFLSIALGWAEILGAFDIFIGVSAIDYSGYPDCRSEFIQAFEKTANLATKAGVEGQKFTIHTPLIHLSKAQTIQKGHALGVDYSQTVSCYRLDESGLACGKCDSCILRKKGFDAAKVPDVTRYLPDASIKF